MSVTSTPIITFADAAAQDAFWEDYCTVKGLSFTDAADAETQGVAHLINIGIGAVAVYRAETAANSEKATTLATQLAALAQ